LCAGRENSSDPNNKPIFEIKRQFENLMVLWKKAMSKTELIVKYINHWYDDVNNDCYIPMEYCRGGGGDLRNEILKRKNENKKFTEEVFNIYEFFNITSFFPLFTYYYILSFSLIII
jgi:hypothetical protein